MEEKAKLKRQSMLGQMIAALNDKYRMDSKIEFDMRNFSTDEMGYATSYAVANNIQIEKNGDLIRFINIGGRRDYDQIGWEDIMFVEAGEADYYVPKTIEQKNGREQLRPCKKNIGSHIEKHWTDGWRFHRWYVISNNGSETPWALIENEDGRITRAVYYDIQFTD